MSTKTPTTFRASGVTQHSQDSREMFRARSQYKAAHPHDDSPGRTAREWFAELRPRLLASIPREQRPHRHLKNSRGKALIVSVVYGPPTFRNVIDENGNHV